MKKRVHLQLARQNLGVKEMSFERTYFVCVFARCNHIALAFLRRNSIATSLSGIYEISRKLYTTILFIEIGFTPVGHHQLDKI